MMRQRSGIVYGGVDTHLDVHVAAVIDGTGRLLGAKSFPTSPLGLRQLERWLAGHGQVAKVGVEGTGTYGLGLQRVLQASGHEVIEVNRPNRQNQSRNDKQNRRTSPIRGFRFIHEQVLETTIDFSPSQGNLEILDVQ